MFGNRQTLLPLHTPPQVPPPVHSLAGSWPSGTAVQVPTLPATSHDSQVPVHAVLQQTPSTHSPELQSAFSSHVPPVSFLATQPPSQVQLESHWPSRLQLVAHEGAVCAAVPSHFTGVKQPHSFAVVPVPHAVSSSAEFVPHLNVEHAGSPRVPWQLVASAHVGAVV